ncbi:MAG TPA: cysteine synthase family protein, partial [Anaeromyxobacteraceae bacterium]|nr:cysteine synthase family protein [Anaeromyxobacteraceae bacterium]
ASAWGATSMSSTSTSSRTSTTAPIRSTPAEALPGLARPRAHPPIESLLGAVGNTPLVRLRRIGAGLPGIRIYAKAEFMNPGGSVKDRAALRMIQVALADGTFAPGRTLIDSTSGNTGIAYAWICSALGLRCTLVMPGNVSLPRKQAARAYGAEVIYSDPLEGSDGAIRKVRELVAAEPERWFYPDQYGNPENPRAHELGTAVEIAEALDGRVAAFVAGMGTSGTVMGTTRGLRHLVPGVRCHGVEPAEPLHGLEGLKHMATSIVPAIYDPAQLDSVISVPTAEGWAMAERLGAEEGLFVGHSAGAAVAGALVVAGQMADRGEAGNVVTVLPDRADRYFDPASWERKGGR